MKDNIRNLDILNRKIVIELRFEPHVLFLDKKGSLIEGLQNLKFNNFKHWEVGDSNLALRDTKEKDLTRNQILVELTRLGYISSQISSIENFYSNFNAIYKVVLDILGEFRITRIGCRILGSYQVKSTTFEDILINFKKTFPNSFFIDDFTAKDLLFHVNYQNGMYEIGPINNDDTFLKREFPYKDRNNNVGIAIDTDNFLLKTSTESIDTPSRIKDVLFASLAVEKSLFENMKMF